MDYSLKGRYTPFGIGFYIGPLFNAILRVGTMEEKEMTFRALLDDDAVSEIPSGKRGEVGEPTQLINEALRYATNAKSRQTRRKNKLSEQIAQVISEEQLAKRKVIIVAIDDFEEEHRALSGLVANELQDYYGRPCMVVFNDGDGTYSGSLRAPDHITAYEGFREQCQGSGLCIWAMGHSLAAGIKLEAENIKKMMDYFDEIYSVIDTDPTYYCDFIISANEPELVDIMEDLVQYDSVWGPGLPEPVIAITDVTLGKGDFSLMSADKNPTLKFKL